MSGAIFLDIKQALRFCRVRQYIACDPFGDINVSYVGRSSGIRIAFLISMKPLMYGLMLTVIIC